MTLIDLPENATPAQIEAAWREYRAGLERMRSRLPESVVSFVLTDWYHDRTDPRCPHDAWVERVEIDQSPQRDTQIRLHLLGSLHDRQLEFVYEKVEDFSLQHLGRHEKGNRDWIQDQLTLTESGLTHEVLFGSGKRWSITCSSIGFAWRLLK